MASLKNENNNAVGDAQASGSPLPAAIDASEKAAQRPSLRQVSSMALKMRARFWIRRPEPWLAMALALLVAGALDWAMRSAAGASRYEEARLWLWGHGWPLYGFCLLMALAGLGPMFWRLARERGLQTDVKAQIEETIAHATDLARAQEEGLLISSAMRPAGAGLSIDSGGLAAPFTPRQRQARRL